MEKIINVKDVEVKVTETQLIFEKDGEEVALDRKMGVADYRLVYSYLNRKGSGMATNGMKTLGKFEYDLQDDKVSIRRQGEEDWLVEDLELTENEVKYVRNAVTKWIINNL